jgi:hypothetical protein
MIDKVSLYQIWNRKEGFEKEVKRSAKHEGNGEVLD